MRQYSVSIAGVTRTVGLEELDQDGALRVLVDGQERLIQVKAVSGRYTWFEGTEVVSAEVEAAGAKLSVALRGHSLLAEVTDAAAASLALAAARAAARPAGPLVVRAPMPGRIVKLLARPGDEVKAGRGLLVVEAMKMENEIRAPRDGKVGAVAVAEGVAVEAGQELVTLE